MEIKEWLMKNKYWFIYPIVIFFGFWGRSIMRSNQTPEPTQVENVREEIIKEEVSEWTLIDEKDRFDENTGKKSMIYKTQGKLENKWDNKIHFLIKKKRIGILEFINENGLPESFRRGRFDMKNSDNEILTVGIIDSWEKGKGVGVIKYSFDGKSGQYDKILKFLLKSKGDIKVVLTQNGENTFFTINTNGFEELYNSSKDILSSGGEEQE
jgi:hypothetical protein